MALSHRAGYGLIVLGTILCSFTFVVSGGTERACPEIDSVVYDTIGIYPAEFRVTGVNLSRFKLEWYDGCNWRDGPLLFLILGFVSVITGLIVSRKSVRSPSK
jgi:hypothetical protein